ncbi:MAG: FAD-linked oxidase C-terminal domain-containing protein [Nitratireductor sp.]
MHPLILYNANKPGDQEKCDTFGLTFSSSVSMVGGCLTGEHGVGIESDLMTVQHNEADLEAQMRARCVRSAWLQPGQVFPMAVSHSRRMRNSQGEAA